MIPKATTLVFLGRSGCGKDTQVEFLKKRRDFSGALEFSTGDLFREISSKDTLLGKKAKEILDTGRRQPDWFAFAMWLLVFGDIVKGEEILLSSGSPRSMREAGLIDETLEFIHRPKAIAIYLDVSREEARKRLLLRGRNDDIDKSIENRMDYFERDVIPAIDYYRKEKRLIEVNGNPPPEEVYKELEKKLEKYFIK